MVEGRDWTTGYSEAIFELPEKLGFSDITRGRSCRKHRFARTTSGSRGIELAQRNCFLFVMFEVLIQPYLPGSDSVEAYAAGSTDV